jgi:hypothetical protein
VPTATPCERYRCQGDVAKEAAMKPADMSRLPKVITRRRPISRVRIVQRGLKSRAQPKMRPPMKA